MNSPFDDALRTGGSWLVLAGLGWAVLLGAATLLEAGTSGRLRAMTWIGCPPALRGALLTGLGVALAGVTTAGAHAAPPAREPAPDLPVPARPVGDPDAVSTGPGTVTVRPHDSLWRIAEAHLPPSVAAQAVADLVRRLHHRNRLVIGSDPDLLHPGQRLVVPALPRTAAPHLEENP